MVKITVYDPEGEEYTLQVECGTHTDDVLAYMAGRLNVPVDCLTCSPSTIYSYEEIQIFIK